jgi:hypothetical protein
MEILGNYAAKDSRIQFGQAPCHLGINDNFYDLIAKSTGDYIAISDQDDVWEVNKIESLLGVIGDASLAYTDSKLIDGAGNDLGMTLLEALRVPPKQGQCLTDLYDQNSISGHACLFVDGLKRIVQHGIAAGVAHHGMYDQFIGTVASFDKGVVYHEVPLTLHRSHDRNSCNQLRVGGGKKGEPKAEQIGPGVRRKAKRKKLQYFKRRKMRVLHKLVKARQKRQRFRFVFEVAALSATNPFIVGGATDKKVENGLFSYSLYRKLRDNDVPRKDAIEICSGKFLYKLFRSL